MAGEFPKLRFDLLMDFEAASETSQDSTSWNETAQSHRDTNARRVISGAHTAASTESLVA